MPDIRLQDYVAKIKDLIQGDRHDEAVAHCQHILRQYPKHIETYCMLGEACLEKGMYRESIELFQRTLSANPESFIARVGLGIIYDEQGALPEAIWQIERAFELAPGTAEVRRELQRLYAQRDGAEKARLKLTRGALGRLYSRNGLYERAIGEFHAVLRQDPDLPDIQVALVEALWCEGRRLEVVETCLELLDALPYCLKANLILGEIWSRGGHEEAAEEKLQVAQALDPENRVAQDMMGKESPLPPEEVLIPELKEIPDVLTLISMGEEPLAEEEMEEAELGLATIEDSELAAAWQETGEFPDWLTEMGVISEEGLGAEEEVQAAGMEEGAPAEEEMPGWLQELMGEESPLLAKKVAPTPGEEERELPEEAPDWLRELEAEEAEVPEAEAVAESEEGELESVEGAEVSDWLEDLEAPAEMVPAEEEEAVEPTVEEPLFEAEVEEAEAVPDWLKEMGEPGATEAAPKEAPTSEDEEEIPDWLRALKPKEVEKAAEPSVGAYEEVEELPDWLQEVELPAEVVSAVEEEVVEPAVEEPSFEAGAVPEVEEAEEVPDWLKALESPEAAEEMAPPVEEVMPEAEVEPLAEEAPEAEVPESLRALVEAGILDESDLASAMAEMSEEDLEAQREEDVPDWLRDLVGEEAPAAEMISAAEEMAPPVEEVAPEAEAMPEVEEAEEVPDWLKALEAPEAAEEMAPPVEEVAPEAEAVPEVEEAEEVPDWLKVLEAPEAAEEMAPPVEEVAPEAKAPEAEVPESLRALVEAGILDESDLASAMAEMSEEDLEAQREEEVPEWLRDLMGEEALAEPVSAAEMLSDLEEAIEPPREEELPEWLREWEEAEAAEVGEAPLEEILTEPEEPPIEDAVEAPVAEVVEEVIEPAMEAPEVAAPEIEVAEPELEEEWVEAAPTLEEKVLEPPMPEVPVVEMVEEVVEPAMEAPEMEEEAAPPSDMEMVAPYDRVEIEEEVPDRERTDDLEQQLKVNPRDYSLRLELARLYREERDWSAALTHYQKLISARKFLPAVLDDLGLLLQEEVDQPRVYQLMGDAYMQQADLDKSLEMYRLAQQALIQQ